MPPGRGGPVPDGRRTRGGGGVGPRDPEHVRGRARRRSGRVTVRRLTSAEYAYAIRDLTGIDIKVGVDASSDSVGGEGFTNFGDVQFVEDTSIERYLEAAKQVAITPLSAQDRWSSTPTPARRAWSSPR